MKFVLDTHVWVWAANNDKRLPPRLRRVLERCSPRDLALPDIALWEAGRIHRVNSLTAGSALDWFARATSQVTVVPLSGPICLLEQSLPWPHRDPADRLIVATALNLALPLMTVDKRMIEWDGVATV